MTFKATWKGDEATPDQKETVWFGITFKKGEAVEVSRPEYVRKLENNPQFTCDGALPVEKPEPLVHIPPSQATMPGAVPKGGETILENPVFAPKPPPVEGPKAPVVTKIPMKKV